MVKPLEPVVMYLTEYGIRHIKPYAINFLIKFVDRLLLLSVDFRNKIYIVFSRTTM